MGINGAVFGSTFLDTFLGLQQRQEVNMQRQQEIELQKSHMDFQLKQADLAMKWKQQEAQTQQEQFDRQMKLREGELDLQKQTRTDALQEKKDEFAALMDYRNRGLNEKTAYGRGKLALSPTLQKLDQTIQEKRLAGADTSAEESERDRINSVLDSLSGMGGGQATQPTQPGEPAATNPNAAAPVPPASTKPARTPQAAPEMQQVIVDTPEEAKRRNAAARKWAPNTVFVTQDELDKQSMQRIDLQQKKHLEEAAGAAESASSLQKDLTQAEIPLEITSTGTEQIRVGDKVHEVPKLDFEGTGLNAFQTKIRGQTIFDVNPHVADDLARLLVAKEVGRKAPITDAKGRVIGNRPDQGVPEPLVQAARRFVQKGADQVGVMTEHAPTVDVYPFDGINNPKAHQAATMTESLRNADEKITALQKFHGSGSEPVALPEVNRIQTPATDVLHRFAEALSKPPDSLTSDTASVERQMLAELKSSLKPNGPNGQYSPGAKEAAQNLVTKLGESSMPAFRGQDRSLQGWSPTFRAQAAQIVSQALKGEAAPTETGKAEGAPIGGTGVQGMAARALVAGGAIGGGGKPPAAVLGSVGPNTRDKEATAQQAISDVRGMSKTDKATAAEQWKTKRATWKNLGVEDDTIAEMDRLLGTKSESKGSVPGGTPKYDADTEALLREVRSTPAAKKLSDRELLQLVENLRHIGG